jgi:plasmid stabilization system protein ParE
MARLAWSPGAAKNLERICEFLAEKNPGAARRAAKAIKDGAETLPAHPEIGRMFDDETPWLREWIIPFGSSAYVLLYQYDHAQATVVAIRHGKEAGFAP